MATNTSWSPGPSTAFVPPKIHAEPSSVAPDQRRCRRFLSEPLERPKRKDHRTSLAPGKQPFISQRGTPVGSTVSGRSLRQTGSRSGLIEVHALSLDFTAFLYRAVVFTCSEKASAAEGRRIKRPTAPALQARSPFGCALRVWHGRAPGRSVRSTRTGFRPEYTGLHRSTW